MDRAEKQEAQRIEALANRDAKTYSRLCSELGVEPEDHDLIERAEADELYSKNPLKDLKKSRVNSIRKEKKVPFERDGARTNLEFKVFTDKLYSQLIKGDVPEVKVSLTNYKSNRGQPITDRTYISKYNIAVVSHCGPYDSEREFKEEALDDAISCLTSSVKYCTTEISRRMRDSAVVVLRRIPLDKIIKSDSPENN